MKMKKVSKSSADMLAMYDVMLLQQAALFKLKDREDRHASRDAVQALFIALQEAIKPDVTLEIGALNAVFSSKMAENGVTAYAFEANSYNFKKFAPKIAATGLPVHYLHRAICEVDGHVDFQVRSVVNGKRKSPIQGNNSLMMRNAAMESAEYETLSVPASRLDTFLAENGLAGSRYSAWIDVEGALSRVTAGFGSALAGCQSILVEVEEISYWDGQMLYLDAMQYFISQGFVPVVRDFEGRHQFNVLFLAPEQLRNAKVRAVLLGYFQKG
jgi:FkbM family methyltransferase